MSLKKKIKTAFTILKIQGLSAVLKILRSKLDTRPRPAEAAIAFDVLTPAGKQGIMFEIGAHHGGSLDPFARAGWRVFAFEPDANNRATLTETFGSLPNVQIDDRAVSDHLEDEVDFFTSKESTGVSGLSSFLPSHKASQKVSLTTLEKFIADNRLKTKTIDFLKIDTEGFDFMVLKGFPWQGKKPLMILCEFEDAKTLPLGYSFHDLAEYLVDKGYDLIISEWHPVKKYGIPHHWKRFTTYPCTLENPKAWGNIFAVRDEELYKRLFAKCKL
ncbi:MAG: FkbM family methyltransferase [Anaerolineaceae bacterium]|nr:FkbM family methyltransferase [Anaerolineaceae bacterium]